MGERHGGVEDRAAFVRRRTVVTQQAAWKAHRGPDTREVGAEWERSGGAAADHQVAVGRDRHRGDLIGDRQLAARRANDGVPQAQATVDGADQRGAAIAGHRQRVDVDGAHHVARHAAADGVDREVGGGRPVGGVARVGVAIATGQKTTLALPAQPPGPAANGCETLRSEPRCVLKAGRARGAEGS